MGVNVYGICDNNCKHPVYTREEVLAILQQAINDGTLQNIDADAAAIKKVMSENGGADVKFWTGTEAEFNALDPAPNATFFIPRRAADGTVYICIDDTKISSMPTAEQVQAAIDGTEKAENAANEAKTAAEAAQGTANAAGTAASNAQSTASAASTAAANAQNTANAANTAAANAQSTANGKASTVTYTATVTNTWTASGDYFYQDVAVSGILAADNPIVDIVCGSDNAANALYSESICKVFRITTAANSVRVWATEAVATAFPIQLKVVR